MMKEKDKNIQKQIQTRLKRKYPKVVTSYVNLQSAMSTYCRQKYENKIKRGEKIMNEIPLRLYRNFGNDCIALGKWLLDKGASDIFLPYYLFLQNYFTDTIACLSFEKDKKNHIKKLDIIYDTMKEINKQTYELIGIKYQKSLIG